MQSKFCNRTFLFRLSTVVVGAVDLGLVASSYFPVFTEEPFLGVICVTFIISLLATIAYIFDVLPETPGTKRLDIFYHGLSFLALFMTGSVFLFSVIGYPTTCPRGASCTHYYSLRYMAAFLGLLNAFLYAMVGWTMLELKIVSRTHAQVTQDPS